MEIQTNDHAFLYLLLSVQVCVGLYASVHLLLSVCVKSRRVQTTYTGMALKVLLFALLARWCYLTADVI